MERPLGAQISHMLKDRGVEVIFGIPGVHNQEMYRGIEEAGLRHVLARHEQGAGFMADGYARATGRPGVCYVITGPGLCNIMTPMGQAYSDSVPMLVISSCLDETYIKQGQLHQMKDQRAAAEAVCAWSVEAHDAEQAMWFVDKAIGEMAAGGRRRPVHIQVPIDVLEGPAPEIEELPRFMDRAAQVAASQVTALAKTLLRAKRPVLVLGGGAKEATDAVQRVLAASNAASFTTYAGRGIVPADNGLHFGSMLARPSSEQVFEQADMVIAVGTDLSEVDLWRDALGGWQRRVFVNSDLAVLERAPLGTQPVCADAQQFMDVFADVLEAETEEVAASTWSEAEVAATCQKWRAEIDAERPGILPVADALRAALPADTMIYSDMTQFAYAAKEIWPMDRPGHWHHPYGFGTLGYAMPAAIGGKIGVGDQPVVAIAGDYGFQYTVQELGAAVELGLSLPIIIWDNGKLGEIEDSMVRAQIAPNAVVQRNPDFCRLAEAYGARSARPERLEDLAAVMADALAADGPTVIHLAADIAQR